MKIKSIPLLLCVVLATWPSTEWLRAADEKSKDAEQAIKKLEQEWAVALVKRDQAVIDRVESPDWMLADAEGNLVSKAKADANLKSGAVVFETVHNDERCAFLVILRLLTVWSPRKSDSRVKILAVSTGSRMFS